MYQKYKTYEEFKDGLFNDDQTLKYSKLTIKIDDYLSYTIRRVGSNIIKYSDADIRKYWKDYINYFVYHNM